MRIPSCHHRDDSRENTPMTSMIDVVFLLLIFFVCAATGQVREELLPTDLAAGSVESPEVQEQDPWVVEIRLHLKQDPQTDQTFVEMNERRYDDFDLLNRQLTELAELGPESPVILEIEPDVPLGPVIRVYDTCRQAGFQSINFATNSSPAGPKQAPKTPSP